MRVHAFALIAVFVLSSVAAVVVAQQCCPGGGCSIADCPLLAPELNLNVQQMSRMKQISDYHCRKTAKIASQIDTQRTHLVTLLGAPRPDRKAADAVARKIGDLVGKLRMLDVEAYLRAREILTPSQAAKLPASKVMDKWKR